MGEVVEKLLSPANDSQNIFTTIGASEIEADFGERPGGEAVQIARHRLAQAPAMHGQRFRMARG